MAELFHALGKLDIIIPQVLVCGLPLFEEPFQPDPQRSAVIATGLCQVPGTHNPHWPSTVAVVRAGPVLYSDAASTFSPRGFGPSSGINSTSVLRLERGAGQRPYYNHGYPLESRHSSRA